MKTLALALAAALAFALPAHAQAQPLPAAKPTPRDLYVSCYLLIQGTDVPRGEDGKAPPFGAVQCGAVALQLIASREGAENKENHKFCLDDSAAVQTNAMREMALAYINFYELRLFKNGEPEAVPYFLLAMIHRWPCPNS